MTNRLNRNYKFKNETYKFCNRSTCESTCGSGNGPCVWDSSDPIQCPAGYKHHPSDKNGYISGRDLDAYGCNQCWPNYGYRVCEHDPDQIESDVWNPLRTEYAVDKTNPEILKKIRDCCSNNVNTDTEKKECGNYLDGYNAGEPDCARVLVQYCNDSLKNMSEPRCLALCKSNPSACDSTNIQEWCEKEIPPAHADVCGCYYKESFYDNLVKELSTKYNVGPEFIKGGRKCMYNKCHNSIFSYPENDECPNLDVTECIQNVVVNADGAKIEKIEVNTSVEKCGKFSPGTEKQPSCEKDSDCSDGTCVLNECVRNTKKPDEKPPSSFPMLIAFGVFVLIGFAIIGYGVINMNKKPKPVA